MSETVDIMARMETDSPTTVANTVPFDTSPLEPPKMEERKPSRISFLRRKVKSKDEHEEETDEAEIRQLEKRVELLERKRQLVLRIKKMERGLKTGYVDSDDDTSTHKRKGSPKKWSSLKPRLWRKHDDSDDELSYDEGDSPLLTGFHGALDCIEAGCDTVINEIVDIKMMFTDCATKDRDKSICTQDIEYTKTPNEKENDVAADDSQEEEAKTADETNVAALAAPIVMLAKTISNRFTGADEAAAAAAAATDSKDVEKVADRPNENANLVDGNGAVQLDDNDNASDIKGAWMEKVLRSHSFAKKDDDNDVGIDCFGSPSSQPKSEIASEQSNETDANFNRVTVTALALSGLSIVSKQSGKVKGENDVPPVHVVLSVLKNDDSSPFVNIPSLRVVKDPSKKEVKKKRSTKYHVMGIWDVAKEDDAAGTEDRKSSASFSTLVGMSTFEGQAADDVHSEKNADVKMSPSMIHLRVCIKRDGSEELLPIGVAKVLVSGGPRNVELAVPLRPEYYKSMDELIKKLSRKPPQTKWDSFKNFVLEDEEEPPVCAKFRRHKETYRLEKDCFIRINLAVAPETQDDAQSPPAVPAPSTTELSNSTELKPNNDDSKSVTDEATAVISDDTGALVSENPVSNEFKGSEAFVEPSVEESKEKCATKKAKKSWFKMSKKGSDEADGKMVGAAAVGAGVGAVAFTAFDSNGKSARASDDASKDGYAFTEQPDNAASATVQTPPTKEDGAATSQAVCPKPVKDSVEEKGVKKSWFKKSKSMKHEHTIQSDSTSPEYPADDNLAASAAADTGVGALAILQQTTSDVDEAQLQPSNPNDAVNNDGDLVASNDSPSPIDVGALTASILKEQSVEESSSALEKSSKDAKDAVLLEAEDGIEAPSLETIAGGVSVSSAVEKAESSDSSAVEKAENSNARKRRGWFAKARKTSKNDANEIKDAAKAEPIDTLSPDKSVNTNDTEASDASNVEDFVDVGAITDMDKEENVSTAKAAEKKNWILKPFRSKKNVSDSTCAIEENSANLVVGAGAAAIVGLANQNTLGSDASIEDLKTKDEMDPVVVEDEEDEIPCFCNLNEMMEADMPTDVAERANCIKDDNVSVDSEEYGGSYLIDNISVVNDLEQDEHDDLSDCNCEDCMNKSRKSNEEKEECEGIELELKPKPHKSIDGSEQDVMKSKMSLRNIVGKYKSKGMVQ